ncbi:sugar transferase [Streptomyces sp. TRM 70351]|uniref:sugar transferase n=1 Tax=Streptomyces sp. TRM 70351 TaxID=3116552 RepID=UPI002E7BC93B|nr:sugar transferase [Streptomyces sp. TRM 70351]MEE1929218.1 sugar transferase [Streptomyces sp. TRM 70351]
MTTESADAPGTGRTLARAPAAPAPPAAAPADHGVPGAFPPPRSSGGPGPGPRRAGAARRTVVPWLAAADCLAACAAAALVAHTAAVPTAQTLATLAPACALTACLNGAAGLCRPPAPGAAAADALPALCGRAAVAWALPAAVWAALHPGQALALTTLLALVAAHTLLSAAGRGGVLARHRRAVRRRPSATLVVGDGPSARRLAAVLHAHPEYGLRPVGLVAAPGHESAEVPADERPLPVLTSPEDVARAVARHAVTEAVLVRAPGGDPHPAAEAVAALTAHGCALWLTDGLAGGPGAPGTPAPETHLWGHGCRRVEPPRPRPGSAAAKRALDLLLAAPALLLAAPLLLLCALAVRLLDGPGVVFRQERVGLGGRSFTLLKFRTLRPADAYESATRWSVAHDRRMSPVGRLLRRTSLDELPQLWNVLRGDMSLVGPRPERPYFVARFSETYPGYAHRHRMPAGITGLAQVHGLRGDTSIEDRARFDNHYVASWSLWQDVRILARTATSLFRHSGS